MKPELAISVRGLSKSFNGRSVVHDCSIDVAAGTIYGFLGPNGTGKTTTIRMLCGLLTPDAGEGTALGYDIRTQGRLIRRVTGYMPQRFGLYEDLTIRENLDFVARVYGVADVRGTVDRAIKSLGLADRREQLAGTLSGGWKQRLALAACTLHAPRLLLLDEPTAGVDPQARRDFWDQIHRFAAEGVTILVSTHYMDEAERCHEIGYLAHGRLLAHGDVHSVIARAGIRTWSVTAGDPIRTAEAIRRLPGVDSATAFGRELHVTARAADAEAVERGLAALGALPGFAWRRAEPSLEDVFIHTMKIAAPRQGRGMTDRFSLARFRALVAKEFIQMLRDRLTFAMMAGVPVMQLLLFGYAINTDPKRLPTALVVTDDSAFARSIVRTLETSEYFRLVLPAATVGEAEQALLRGDVQFVLTIPADFGRDLVRGAKPVVLLEADASDPVATGTALAAIDEIGRRALRYDLVGALAPLRQGDPPFELRVHRRYNPEGATEYNVVPGLIGTILQMTMVMMTAIAVTRERERGTMETLLATPARPLEIMLGKIAPFIVVGAAQVMIIVLVARLLFDVPLEGDLALLGLALLLFIAVNLAIGFTFSTVAENQLQAMQMTFFFFLPSILLSGFMFPFRGMPGWAQAIGEALPMTHVLRAVRGIMLKGADLAAIAPTLWTLAGILVIVAAVAVMRFRQTLD